MDAEERIAVRIGGVVLVVVALAAALLLVVQGRHLRPGLRVEVELARIGTLQAGAPVRLAGLTLGSVDDIRLVPAPPGSSEKAHALLDVWLDRRHARLVRETTDFFVNQEGLLGEAYLGIAERPGAPGRPLADGARVRGVAPPEIDKLLAASYRNLEAITSLLRDGLPEIDELRAALAALDGTVAGLDAAPLWSAGGRLVAEARGFAVPEPPSMPAFDVAPLEARVAALAAEVDRLAPRLADPRVARLAAVLGRAPELVARARSALAAAEAIAAMVASGQGTVGALLADVELFDEMKDLSRTLKRQPWRAVTR
jgi:phospholipid/cholesterol/gamma-HCH transport system substrate-binding protein